METPHILIVDDDKAIRDLLAEYLIQQKMKVSTAKNGDEMYQTLLKEKIDLIVLDIMMPGKSGLDLCREMRQTSNVPILILTALDEDTEQVVGLELGADDYVTKPFNPRILLAKIRTILRRFEGSEATSSSQDNLQPLKYEFLGWILDTASRSLFSPEKVETILSTAEYDLLIVFLERPQRVLSRDILLDVTRNREAGPFDRSIDVLISRLRSKLETDPKNPQLIKTIRGGGYLCTAQVNKVE